MAVVRMMKDNFMLAEVYYPVLESHVFAVLLAIPAGLERQICHVPIRMRVQYGLVYLRHNGMILQHARHVHRVLSMPLHSHVEGAQSPS